ncbi:helix-turn-helix transcriptional regulator [Aeromonas caviae]|uniref:helix-turn-helix transcriptional regulator n=1 Tax=Aeromonas caviae TaxID=648 RepID=UPI0029DAE277|nr:helix-turn-helix transcriptional regulator [Aeromonas caviae]MDX7711765.1 helix-turn-helix transcriptional regulator [Aeromonas caviae]
MTRTTEMTDVDPEVAMILKTMGNYIAARRKELGFRQSDVAESAGLTPATIIRVEKGGGQIRLVTFLTYLKELGELSVFGDLFTNLDDGSRRRIRTPTVQEIETDGPLSAAQFLARVQAEPKLELEVTRRAAVSLVRTGNYAVRDEDGKVLACSIDQAKLSEHEYQTADGHVGGVSRMRLVLSESALTDEQLTTVRFIGYANLMKRVNDRLEAREVTAVVDKIDVVPEGPHSLFFVKDDREVGSQFVYDIILNSLEEKI